MALTTHDSAFLRPAMAQEGERVVDHQAAAAAAAETVKETVSETVQEVVEEVKETVKETVREVEEAVEAVAEETPKVPAEPEKVAETVKERAIDTPSETPIAVMKEKISALVDKVKSLDKSAWKKVAAGAVGVWGVSLAVGWLTKGTPAGVEVAASDKKRR